jgi:hypothetical protein
MTMTRAGPKSRHPALNIHHMILLTARHGWWIVALTMSCALSLMFLTLALWIIQWSAWLSLRSGALVFVVSRSVVSHVYSAIAGMDSFMFAMHRCGMRPTRPV